MRKILVAIFVVLVGTGVGMLIAMIRHGFSAREKPWRVEAFLARNVRRMAIPAGANRLENPLLSSPEILAEARDHFADHCAICHGNEGQGNTVIGRNLYPPAPDMTQEETQRLTDGELFYIITNGIRFTGMPAWEEEHTDEETWKQVLFIRHLPNLTPEELEMMEVGEEAPHGNDTTQEEIRKPGRPHTHKPGTTPH